MSECEDPQGRNMERLIMENAEKARRCASEVELSKSPTFPNQKASCLLGKMSYKSAPARAEARIPIRCTLKIILPTMPPGYFFIYNCGLNYSSPHQGVLCYFADVFSAAKWAFHYAEQFYCFFVSIWTICLFFNRLKNTAWFFLGCFICIQRENSVSLYKAPVFQDEERKKTSWRWQVEESFSTGQITRKMHESEFCFDAGLTIWVSKDLREQILSFHILSQ